MRIFALKLVNTIIWIKYRQFLFQVVFLSTIYWLKINFTSLDPHTEFSTIKISNSIIKIRLKCLFLIAYEFRIITYSACVNLFVSVWRSKEAEKNY